MKRGSGIKDRDDKSSGLVILMSEAFAKINPTLFIMNPHWPLHSFIYLLWINKAKAKDKIYVWVIETRLITEMFANVMGECEN